MPVRTRGTKGTPPTKKILFVMLESYIDRTKLQNVRSRGDDIICACPACREEGKDRAGDNMKIFTSGAYCCIARPRDSDHNRRIFALVGVRGEPQAADPSEARKRRDKATRQRLQDSDIETVRKTARELRAALVERWKWETADVWEDSPQRCDGDLVCTDPRHFLDTLFPEDAVIWTGHAHESGMDGIHSERWMTAAEWKGEQRVGPMTTPAIWVTGTTSRTAANVSSAPYVILDFDGFDGRKPSTPTEIQEHVAASRALIRWIRDGLGWKLAAILATGSVGLHAWFHTPPPDVLESLKTAAKEFGLDAGLLGHPEHPCRLPGHKHDKTGVPSEILWLQEAIPLLH